MAGMELGVIERRFADVIWQRAPVRSSELVALAAAEFQWKRTTTHTVIRRLCDKGLFINEGGTIRALVSREQYDSRQSRQFVAEAFQGSLPAFVAAFTRGKSLTSEEAEALREMIDRAEETP